MDRSIQGLGKQGCDGFAFVAMVMVSPSSFEISFDRESNCFLSFWCHSERDKPCDDGQDHYEKVVTIY